MTKDLRVARRLVRDTDSHWYLVPVSEIERFHNWVRETDTPDGGCDDDWALFNDECRIDGPHAINIFEYEVVR